MVVRRNNNNWFGLAQWCIVGLAVLAVVFNTGVTYNHLHGLSVKVEKMTVKVDKLSEDIAGIKVGLESIRLIIGLDKVQK